MDYAGYWTQYLASNGISLGTTTIGTVQQSDNGDGTSTLKVQLDTTNALATCRATPHSLRLISGLSRVQLRPGAWRLSELRICRQCLLLLAPVQLLCCLISRMSPRARHRLRV